MAEFKASADRLVRALRSVKPTVGFERVISPGQTDAANEAQRKIEGVPIRDEVWEQVIATAVRLGVVFEL